MLKDKNKIPKDGDEIPKDVLDAIPEIVKAMKNIKIEYDRQTGLVDTSCKCRKK